jgi:membrane-associated phospholipid phosphatase
VNNRHTNSGLKTRYAGIPFHLLDYVVWGYLFIVGLLVITFNSRVERWWIYPAAHAILSIIILELIRSSHKNRSGILRFLRTFYPALLLPLAWTELDPLILMVIPRYWANDFLLNLDKALFSVHPTVWLGDTFFARAPWLTELMNLFYASYFLFIPIGGLTLYCRGRKKETLEFMFLVILTYSVSFLLFFLFPAEGPWVLLKEKHLTEPVGGIFLRLNQFMQGHGSNEGCCFPSSHVAASFAAVWATLRYQRVLGWILLVLATGVAVATVYCQYHHAVDAIAGFILGSLLYIAGRFFLKKWEENASDMKKQPVK